jgi:hypothetical protein
MTLLKKSSFCIGYPAGPAPILTPILTSSHQMHPSSEAVVDTYTKSNFTAQSVKKQHRSGSIAFIW